MIANQYEIPNAIAWTGMTSNHTDNISYRSIDDLKYQRIIQAVMEMPWAILPGKLAVIRDLLAYKASGGLLTEDEIRQQLAVRDNGHYMAATQDNPPRKPYYFNQGVAVLPMIGTIVPRADLFSEMSGAVSVTGFQKRFQYAVADEDVTEIIIEVDSPGGQVAGVPELAAAIFQARGDKKITAVTNSLAASAAYWLATSADELVVTPSGEVGSIGVFAIHEDLSGYLDDQGIKMSLVYAGKYKTEGNPFEPLGDEARAAIQERVNDYYQMFVDGVAQNRAMKSAYIREGFGQGRLVGAKDAVTLGMADRVATLDHVLRDVIAGNQKVVVAGVELQQKGASRMTVIEEQTQQIKVVEAIETADGYQVTAADFEEMRRKLEKQRAEVQKSKIEAALQVAREHGVAPAVMQVVAAMMTNCELEATPTLQIDEQEFNLFGALGYLLTIIPGRSLAEETTKTVAGEKPPAENPKPGQEDRMTLEEAEAKARERRKELKVRPIREVELA